MPELPLTFTGCESGHTPSSGATQADGSLVLSQTLTADDGTANRMSLVDVNGDGISEVLAVGGPGASPIVRTFQLGGVDPNTNAAQQLRPGDVIEQINRQPISNVDDFQNVVGQLDPNRPVIVGVARNRQRSFVLIQPD